MNFLVKAVAGAALVLVVPSVLPAQSPKDVTMQVQSEEAAALAGLEKQLLTSKDMDGYRKYRELNVAQRHELASYLTGRRDQRRMRNMQRVASNPRGDASGFEQVAEVSGDERSVRMLQAGSRTAWAKQAFLFAGIKISETKVTVRYETNGSSATKILGYDCVVLRNFDPMAEISMWRSNAYISGGKATAECKVRVKRGSPTPWGQVTWSTRENVQFLTARGDGKVVGQGWR